MYFISVNNQVNLFPRLTTSVKPGCTQSKSISQGITFLLSYYQSINYKLHCFLLHKFPSIYFLSVMIIGNLRYRRSVLIDMIERRKTESCNNTHCYVVQDVSITDLASACHVAFLGQCITT